MNSSKFNHGFFVLFCFVFYKITCLLALFKPKKKKKGDCALIGKEYYYTFRKFQRKVIKHQIEH